MAGEGVGWVIGGPVVPAGLGEGLAADTRRDGDGSISPDVGPQNDSLTSPASVVT